MALRTGNRMQISMLPACIDDYVKEDDPVRVYNAIIDKLDFAKLGIEIDHNKEGCPEYEPKSMLKLLVYGYSYGWRSSRKLERACHHDLSFIWLMGGMKPNYKTIARFRKENQGSIAKVMKECAKLCMMLGAIEGNTLFLDGTKIRANASVNATRTKENLKKKIEEIETKITEVLTECNKTDKEEEGNSSLVKVQKKLAKKEKLKKKLEKLLNKMIMEEKETINITDVECANMKGRQGTHASYNVQAVADEKYGLVVNCDVVTTGNDMNQFTEQIDKANEVLGKQCETACADAGYSCTQDLEKSVEKKIEVIVPSQRQALHNKPQEEEPFSKDKFKYDEKNDTYICPEGKTMEKMRHKKEKKEFVYQIKDKSICKNCKNFEKCTSSKNGRRITRLEAEKTKEYLEKLYQSERGQEVFKKRKTKIELVFGHIKRNLNGGHFLIRGKKGGNAEMSIFCTCFNVARLMTIMGGVCPLIEMLEAIG